SPLPQDSIPRAQQGIAVDGVGSLEDRLTAGRLDATNPLPATVLIAADDRDARSGAGQRLGHPAAEDARAAEDHGCLFPQIKKVVFHILYIPGCVSASQRRMAINRGLPVF